jgi:hypothetical protein
MESEDTGAWQLRQFLNHCHLTYDTCIQGAANAGSYTITFSKPTPQQPVPRDVVVAHCTLQVTKSKVTCRFVYEQQFTTYEARWEVDAKDNVVPGSIQGDLFRDASVDAEVGQKNAIRAQFTSLQRNVE